MKLEKLKGYEEWIMNERSYIYEKLLDEYCEYKESLDKDNICLAMEDETRYIVPNMTLNNFLKTLKENNIEIKNIKRIESRF